jgi:hypothetical protein
MFNQKYIILYIDRNRIQLFGGSLTGIVTIEIPDAIVSDVDIIRKDDIYTLIKQCVKQYALSGQLVIVLSQAIYFEKLFPNIDSPQTESDILKFFDSVPYESVWTKVYQTPKGKHAVAINKAFYEAYRQGFLLQGLSTRALIPSSVLGQESTKQALDKQMADYIYNNIDTLTKQSILDTQETALPTIREEKESPNTKPKSNIVPLLSVFGLLLVILIVVAITQL